MRLRNVNKIKSMVKGIKGLKVNFVLKLIFNAILSAKVSGSSVGYFAAVFAILITPIAKYNPSMS